MATPAKIWYFVTAVVVIAYLTVALSLKPGHPLTVFGDVTQFAILGIAFVVMVRQIFLHRGRQRGFWLFLAFGAVLWFLAQGEWVWHEVILRSDVPDPSLGDVLLFIHTVPLMGALTLRPHLRQDEHRREIDRVDFTLLLLWWVYLYAFVVMPWQFSTAVDLLQAGRYYSALYFCENVIMVLAAGMLWMGSTGSWRKVYSNLVISGFFYALCSVLVNRMIFLQKYYTGSLYDVPLVASLCFFVAVGLVKPASSIDEVHVDSLLVVPSAWPTALATLALVSMPLLALWSAFWHPAPPAVSDFRLKTTFAAMLLFLVLLFFKQRLLNRQLTHLLRDSQESYSNLERMQHHLVHSEKLAALGHIVAKAAHDISDPLAEILGCSQMLTTLPSVPQSPRSIAEKIGEQTRRTQRLVTNLLSFAQQTPMEKTRVQLNELLKNAVQLREPDLSGKKIQINCHLDPELPSVRGDSNQLLQVFLHIMNNAVDALQEVSGGILTIGSSSQTGWVLVEFSDTGSGVKDPERIFDPFFTTKPVGKGTGLGLSACYGILQEHGGEISCHNNAAGGASFVMRLPIDGAFDEGMHSENAAEIAAKTAKH